MRSDKDSEKILCALGASIDALTQAANSLRQWLKSHCEVATLKDLEAMERRIRMTQVELAASLDKLTTQSGKIALEQSTRFDTLTQRIKELEDAINAGGAVSPEVETALTNLQAAQQSLDDAIPDAPTV